MSAADSISGDDVASPCIGICQLDAASVCMGCGRSIQEIAEWSRAPNERRRAIVITALRRQTARPAGTAS